MLSVSKPKVPALCKAKGFTSDEFTQAELQFMKSLIEKELTFLSNETRWRKCLLSTLWEDCNPDDPYSQENFNVFSSGLVKYKKAKLKKSKLEIIQRKIKKQMQSRA